MEFNTEFIERLQDVTPILEGRADETLAELREVMKENLRICRENGVDLDTAIHLGARYVMDTTVDSGVEVASSTFFILVYALVRGIVREIVAGEKPESPTSTEKEV